VTHEVVTDHPKAVDIDQRIAELRDAPAVSAARPGRPIYSQVLTPP
jgi:hypothetical protein